MSKRRRIVLALGGFLLFVGVIIFGVFALVLTQVVDVSKLEGVFQNVDRRMLFWGILLVVGVLDVVSAIMLRRW